MSGIAALPTHHQPLLVAASFVLAVLASFVALDLGRRVRADGSLLSRLWWMGGSLAMGTGIWSAHFVGMLGFDAGIALGYREGPTLLSWLAGVAAAGVALAVAAHQRPGPTRLTLGTLAMAGGISSMHYLGMSALDLAPGVQWHRVGVLTSIAVAVLASAAALHLFGLVNRSIGQRRLRAQAGAALLMGLAICGMHYTGMAAATLPLGAVCLSTDGLGGLNLALLVAGATLLMLALALVASMRDLHRQRHGVRLARTLQATNRELLGANEQLQSIAFHDALTGLPNRLGFESRLEAAAEQCDKADPSAQLAVLFVDLDGFKPVNDCLGHSSGDAVLVEVAQRLQAVLPPQAMLARIGGDEFVALLQATDAGAAAVALARRLHQALDSPLLAARQPLTLSCSIGVALYPPHGPAERLLAHADAAMYAAKRKGGAAWALFEPAMDSHAAEQLQLQEDLRHAVERGELSLHYQPQLSPCGELVQGVEALLRWRHPQRGMVSPAVFVPVAERFGLIGSIGHWVMAQACAQLADWVQQGWTGRVAINLSAHQLREVDLADRLRHLLQQHGLDPARLVCEITESTLVENLADGSHPLAALREVGVMLSIDDFGTGYSSLSYLRRLPARELKIDRSLVADVADNREARAIVKAVVQLAHALRMQVVAEGVETEAQRRALADLGCDLLQGFFFARPMAAEALWAWTRAHDEALDQAQAVRDATSAPHNSPGLVGALS